MKRRGMATLLLLGSCLMGTVPALAAGNLAAQEDALHVFVDEYDGTAVFEYTALVENTGDAEAIAGETALLLLDAAGETLYTAEDWPTLLPQMLAPGEQGILILSGSLPDGFDRGAVATHRLEIGSDPNDGAYGTMVRLPAEGSIEIEGEEDMRVAWASVRVTNPTGSLAFEPAFALLFRDEAGKMIGAAGQEYFFGVGIPEGGTLFLRASINWDLDRYFLESSITPLAAEAIAFIELPME